MLSDDKWYRGVSRKGLPKPSLVLRDFRSVYLKPQEDDLPRHKPLRRILDEEPAKFMAQFERLERAHQEDMDWALAEAR